LSEEGHAAVARSHDEFQKTVTEIVFTEALGDPSQTATVRVRDGAPSVTQGPDLHAGDFLCGYYLLDCASLAHASNSPHASPTPGTRQSRSARSPHQFGTSDQP
jgi:hypothetical protein